MGGEAGRHSELVVRMKVHFQTTQRNDLEVRQRDLPDPDGGNAICDNSEAGCRMHQTVGR
jgi:hypothetical protein